MFLFLLLFLCFFKPQNVFITSSLHFSSTPDHRKWILWPFRACVLYIKRRAREKGHRIHFQWSRGLKKQERYVKISKFIFLWNLFDFSSFLFRGPPCAFPLAPHFPKFCLAFISKAARRGLRPCKTLFFLCENRDKQRPGNLETLFVLPEYLLYNITRK